MNGPGKPIPERKLGKFTLRVVERAGAFSGVVLPDTGGRIGPFEGKSAEDVWRRLEEEVGKAAQGYVGFAGATARFLRFFPKGFADPDYAGRERDYKLAAKTKLDSAVPLGEASAGRSGFGEAILSIFYATNLLPSFEQIAVKNLLRGPLANAFTQAAARFASNEGEPPLLEMNQILRSSNCAKWTIATYLPFLWRPDAHMFLKPEVTKEFASRVGHPFAHDYEPRLGIGVYRSLLGLVRRTEEELASAGLNPQDHLDVQSYIYVVGAYDDVDAPHPPSKAE